MRRNNRKKKKKMGAVSCDALTTDELQVQAVLGTSWASLPNLFAFFVTQMPGLESHPDPRGQIRGGGPFVCIITTL